VDELLARLKELIVESLRLEDVAPESIDSDAPLFGEPLGLDSIDALELVVMVEKHYGIRITEMETGRKAFESVRSLAEFIQSKGTLPE
jgi:acyl carrier protein